MISSLLCQVISSMSLDVYLLVLVVVVLNFLTAVTSGTSISLVSTPLHTSSPSPSSTSTPEGKNSESIVWILAGALGGGCILIGMMIIVMIVVGARMKRKKNVNQGQGHQKHIQSLQASTLSKVRSVKYLRPTLSRNGSRNINNHVTVARTESGQHRHIQAVNRGYLLADANPKDGVMSMKELKKPPPMVVLSTKPREEQEEDYDSDYSEVAITTGLQDSQGITTCENVAYDVDELEVDAWRNHIATLQAGSTAVEHASDGHQAAKQKPPVKSKPKFVATKSRSEDSYPRSPPTSGSAPTGVYDVVKSEYGAELSAVYDVPQPRSSQEIKESIANNNCKGPGPQELLYYNQTGQIKQQRERVYYNQTELKQEADENLYHNQNTKVTQLPNH